MILVVGCLVDLQKRKADHIGGSLCEIHENTCHGRDERRDDYRTILRDLVPPRFLRQEESRGVRMGPDGTDGKTRTKREFLF